jgi:tRNA(Ile)-lysidine synthetase, N-terminal domain/tRNA(Ile)-lysidine synthetase, C-terminal domain
METEALRRVRELTERNHLLTQGSGVVVGFSGGSDSLCLLLLLRELAEELALSITAVHVNHMIRGAEADRDEAFCRDFCEQRGISFRSVRVDVPALAAERGTGLEETGRAERYRIFGEIAGEFGATRVAVAHHADDNAETILMHLVRGSGLRGLAGIPADSTPFEDKNIHLIRPLLSIGKDDVLEELRRRGAAYCVDATNYEAEGDRNTLRNRIMPLLHELNPRAGEHIAAAGTHLTAAWQLLDDAAEKEFRRLYGGADGESSRGEHELDVEGFLGLPYALRGEVAIRYLSAVCGHRKDLTYEHAEMVGRLCESSVSAQAMFPYGVTLVRGYRSIHPKGEAETFAGRHEIARRELERGVKVTFYGARPRVFTFAVRDRGECDEYSNNPYTKLFDYDTMGKACVIRTRRPGDRITVTFDGHTKSVQDVFVNRKVPRDERDALPIILTADESAVIWIPGIRGSEAYRVTDDTKRVLVITMEEL